MIDFNNKGFFKLKQDSDFADKARDLLIDDERVIDSYKSMRDGVMFKALQEVKKILHLCLTKILSLTLLKHRGHSISIPN
jgi:hypothetical protein